MASGWRGAVVVAIGIFLFVGTVYAWFGSGRIDMIDGLGRMRRSTDIVRERSTEISIHAADIR